MKFNLYYEFFRSYSRFGLKQAFCRKFQTEGYKDYLVPLKHHPSILTCDHQNALVDALHLGAALRREYQPYFWTRSDIFGSFFDPILRSWKLRPIYRAQDNIKDVVKANEEIFDEMVQKFSQGDRLIIFPEGNHSRVRRLRPLKKGFVRMAFQAEERHNFTLDMLIFPCGVNYSEHLYPGAEVFVKFGPPIRLADYRELYDQNPNRAMIDIRRDTAEAMKKLIHHISNETFYEVIDSVRDFGGKSLLHAEGKEIDDLSLRFVKEKEIIALLESKIDAQDSAWEPFAETVKSYQTILNEEKITDDEVRNKPAATTGLLLQALLFLIGLPIYGFGTLFNILPYGFANRFAINKLKDDHFHSSIRFAFSLFLYPIYWIILWAIGWAITGSFTASLLWLSALIASAIFALRYYRAWKDFGKKWRWNRIVNSNQALAEKIRDLRGAWWTQLSSWYQMLPTVKQ
ncbi:MAG: 1-acyl-sn-glycerol-3-phosphate acyltransferase [Bacteroidia bacterium]|nr:1-acyl-sn-glycerol-3-phosphate acyltransferase [Bacteroidia bacterium]